MNRGVAVLVALFAVGFWSLVEAGLDEGIAAFRSNDYQTAFREMLPLADQGVAEAQVLLGVMYSNGLGVTKNPSKAVQLFRLAAEQGLAHAQYNLGDMYFLGLGIARNNTEAMKWYERAAKQGHPQAQFNLASMYAVAQDYVFAYMWCGLSASNTPAGETRDRAVHRCDRILPGMTPQEVARAKELASKFIPKQERISHPLFQTVR